MAPLTHPSVQDGETRRLENKPLKKVLLLGSGFVARPCTEYLARNPSNTVTIACRTLASAEELAASLPATTAISLDATDTAALDAVVAAHDLVISLIPFTFHAAVITAAIKGKTNVVTTSYVSPAMRALDQAAKDAGIIVLNEVGLDPGLDHLYALKTITEVHARGGKIKHFTSYAGGLPAPECADNPLGYKFSWSARGAIGGLLNSASYYARGEKVTLSGREVMEHAQPRFVMPALALVAYPNRDATPFREYYNIPEAETVVRGSLRYQGFPEIVLALVDIGWLDPVEKEWIAPSLTWAEATQRATGAATADEATLLARVHALCRFPSVAEAARVITALRWIGLFSAAPLPPSRTPLDALCTQLEPLMKYGPGERDMILVQHTFDIEWADGAAETRTATLAAYGAPTGTGHSAMARTVGVPCGIAAQLVLDGVLTEPGVHAPYRREFCEPLREQVEKEGLGFVEKII